MLWIARQVRLFCVFALCAVLWSGMVCSQAVAGQDSAATPPAPSRLPLSPRNDLPGLPNFAQVSPSLYRGAQPTVEGFARLKAMGIKTVVGLREYHSDTKALKGLGIKYVPIAISTGSPNEAQALQFLRLMQDSNNWPVFVHCKHGSDRTGMMVALYRMVFQDWTREEALRELPAFGFHTIWEDIRDYLNEVDPSALRAKIAPK